MEEVAGVSYLSTGSIRVDSPAVIRYADDLVALCHTRQQALQIKARLAAWLAPRGLAFNEDKTRVVTLDEGFDFLGFHVRRYANKPLIRPSKAAVRRIRQRLRTELRSLRGHNARAVTRRLNPIIRGWAAYYRTQASSQTFGALDHYLWQLTYKWAAFSHPNKPTDWVVHRYFGAFNKARRDQWVFGDRSSGAFMHRLLRRAARRFAARKVRVARHIALRANPSITFEGIVGDVADDEVARRITDCDFIFLAADMMLARDVVNQIAYQYLIPTLQVGSKVVIDKKTGKVLDVFGVVRTLGIAAGCLSCGDLIDPVRLSEESLGDPVQVANQRYVDDPEVHPPSVITLNAMASGWAANDFMQYMAGLRRPRGGFRILRTMPVNDKSPHVTVQEPTPDPTCYAYGPDGVRACGDGRDLPTRVKS